MSRFIDRAELFNRLSDVKTLAAAMAVIQDMPAAETKNVHDTNVGDIINRQAAIDVMCLACGRDCDKREFVYDAPQDEQVILCPEHYGLSILPPAQQWIPVTERLPKTYKDVLVSKHGKTRLGYRSVSYWMVISGEGSFTTTDVDAWMPLPEPYKMDEVMEE